MSEEFERPVFEAVRDGCTTATAVCRRLQALGKHQFHPNLNRIVNRTLIRLRKQRLLMECNKREHGKTGWHLRPGAP